MIVQMKEDERAYQERLQEILDTFNIDSHKEIEELKNALKKD